MPQGSIVLEKDPPAICAEKLITGAVDISLIPVGALLSLPDYHIIGNHCIGANERVATVELFSECPLNEIERIYLDHDSRTSNLLAQVLAKRHWKITPEWIQPERGYEEKIKGSTAGVIIGNRAFSYTDKIKYSTDLAEEWQTMTGLPFVFACWASLKPIDESFVTKFEKALSLGFEHLDDAINAFGTTFSIDIKSYLTKNISFEFDEPKRKAMQLFAAYVKELGK